MTATEQAQTTEAAEALVGRLFNAALGAAELYTIQLGATHGLYRALDDAGSATAVELADATGVELRFFMPVLNVPFRLIYAWNPQREGVLDNNLQPAKKSVFRFAVGTTF